jgi:hypothetical protein
LVVALMPQGGTDATLDKFLRSTIIPPVPALTLDQARVKLTEWLTAETKVAEGQAYQIAGRMMTRADLAAIAERIAYYSKLVDQLEARGTTRGIRIRQGVPS